MSKNINSIPSTSSHNGSSTACAFINDTDGNVLNKVVEHLQVKGRDLADKSSKNTSNKDKSSTLHLDTKYYTCDVPVVSFNSFENFAEQHQSKENKIIYLALVVCASPNELDDVFLARLSQICTIQSIDAKTLVLNDLINNKLNDFKSIDENKLKKFAVSRNIEIIYLNNESKLNSSDSDNDEDEEYGTKGIARIIEVLETVKWNGIKLKQNPIKSINHKKQLLEYLKEINFEENFENNNWGENFNIQEKKEATDYPDSEDEEAILEWFDRPLTRNFKIDDFQLSTYSNQSSNQFMPQNLTSQSQNNQENNNNNLIRRRFEGNK